MKRNDEAISASVSKSVKTKLLRMAKRSGHALSAEIRVALETWVITYYGQKPVRQNKKSGNSRKK